MVTDIATLLRVGARLQARLLGTPLGALGAPATEIVRKRIARRGSSIRFTTA